MSRVLELDASLLDAELCSSLASRIQAAAAYLPGLYLHLLASEYADRLLFVPHSLPSSEPSARSRAL